MKKIVIVNNNMKVGGVQKSLYNLLWAIEGKYDITVCLFRKSGAYARGFPPSVKVIEARGLFRYLGMSQGECKGVDALKRGVLVAASRMLGRRKVLGAIARIQPKLEGSYDCAISYLHNGRKKSFYGGVQDFVLNCVRATKKVAFLHCDYDNCGANHADNNRQLERFDRIATCSDGGRRVFLSVLPHLENSCMTVQNCHNYEEIRALANEDPVEYDPNFVNVVFVARLSAEKGVDRAIKAVSAVRKAGVPIRLHIVGDGAERESSLQIVKEENMEESVEFVGEQSNPYRYMKGADLLLVTSYHEAAPMVIDEARSLGLPVLTTATISSKDMVVDRGCGWECDNTQQAIDAALCSITSDKEKLSSLKKSLSDKTVDNSLAVTQFAALLDFENNSRI